MRGAGTTSVRTKSNSALARDSEIKRRSYVSWKCSRPWNPLINSDRPMEGQRGPPVKYNSSIRRPQNVAPAASKAPK